MISVVERQRPKAVCRGQLVGSELEPVSLSTLQLGAISGLFEIEVLGL